MKKFLIWLCVCFVSSSIYAAGKTNINKTTDLFDQNIKNKNALFEDLNKQNENAVSKIESKSAIGLIEGSQEAENNAQQLNSIKATDLDNAGRDKRNSEEFKFYDENEFEPDYTKSGNRQHKLDANDISSATVKRMFDLKNKLNELGLDCKTVKGAVEKEPTYHIEIQREEQKNTEYDQFFCEEPRGKYSCSDEVTLRCVRRGGGIHKPGTIRFSREEMPNSWWLHRGEEGEIVHGMFGNSSFIIFNNAIREEVKQKIIEKTQVPVAEVPPQEILIWIMSDVKYQLDALGNHGNRPGGFHSASEKFNGSIQFFYKVFDEEKCLEWAEDWTEKCRLQ